MNKNYKGIIFNIGNPSYEELIDKNNLDSMYHGNTYQNEVQNEQHKLFKFDNKIINWEIEVYYIEPKRIQGFIKIFSKKGELYTDDDGTKKNYILCEFIYFNYNRFDIKPYRWRARNTQYSLLNTANKDTIDKELPNIYKTARDWDRIRQKFNDNLKKD